MWRYTFKRLLMMIPTFIGITVITFLIIQLAPGDPAYLKAQSGSGSVTSESMAAGIVEQTRILYGLDQPLPVQYWKWVNRLVRLDLGRSYLDQRPVIDKIGEALPITLALNVISVSLLYIISVPLGTYLALRNGRRRERLITMLLFFLYSLPSFWVAMMLMIYLAGGDYLDMFPIAGFISSGADTLPWYRMILNVMWHLVLPIICLTYGGLAFMSRFTKSSVLEVARDDFMRTARAKGLMPWKAMWRHGLRNALIPLVTLVGSLLPAMIGGSVIIEQIFSIPGMGRLGFESVLARDYPVIMGIAAMSAILTLVGMLLSDLLYAVVDPRIRLGGES